MYMYVELEGIGGLVNCTEDFRPLWGNQGNYGPYRAGRATQQQCIKQTVQYVVKYDQCIGVYSVILDIVIVEQGHFDSHLDCCGCLQEVDTAEDSKGF